MDSVVQGQGVHHIYDRDDRLSNLPDCILHHILSYLSTTEAVATCVLSKRWQHIWKFVPNVDFDDSILYSSQQDLSSAWFMNSVEQVLLRRGTFNLKRFRLSCRVCFSASRINDWISAGIRLNVEELDLCLFVEEPFMLPCCVFDNQLIQVIRLEMNCFLQLPARISFLGLRTLHLCLVTFPSDNTMQRLFTNCPCLEELAILDCEWINLRSISISMPSLKILIIDDMPFCTADDFRGCEIKIDAGNLIKFTYDGFLSNGVNVIDISPSAFASIRVRVPPVKNSEIRTLKLFRGLKNVGGLRISDKTMESLLHADEFLDFFQEFENLTLLELKGNLGKQSIQLFMKFLHRLPKLESLRLFKGLGLHCKDVSRPEVAPNGIFRTLKTVDYYNFQGSQNEVCFLQVLLQNSALLKKMNVCWSEISVTDGTYREVITDQLDAHPRGSNQCVIMFT